jgi:hypothetical protein
LKHNGSYYDLPPDCETLQDVIFAKDMQWNLANILKAAYRGKDKGVSNDPIENLTYNLEKIKWFADDYLRRIYEECPDNPRGAGNAIKDDTGS